MSIAPLYDIELEQMLDGDATGTRDDECAMKCGRAAVYDSRHDDCSVRLCSVDTDGAIEVIADAIKRRDVIHCHVCGARAVNPRAITIARIGGKP